MMSQYMTVNGTKMKSQSFPIFSALLNTKNNRFFNNKPYRAKFHSGLNLYFEESLRSLFRELVKYCKVCILHKIKHLGILTLINKIIYF